MFFGFNGVFFDIFVCIYKLIEFLFVCKEKGIYLIDFWVCFLVNEWICIFGMVWYDCFKFNICRYLVLYMYDGVNKLYVFF